MKDSNDDRSLWFNLPTEDVMLPSFELAQMLATLTLDEPQHLETAGARLNESGRRTISVTGAYDFSTIPPPPTRYEVHNVGDLGEPLVEPGQVLAKYQDTMLPRLRSLFPRQMVQQLAPHPTDTAERQQEALSAAQLKFLIFCAINNFAGFDQPDMKMMHSYLSNTIHIVAQQTARARSVREKLLNMPSAKPMTEAFFRCAIEAGDAVAARSLLHWKEAGISANDQICVVEGYRYTPVERAAKLQHTKLTQTLIEFGADVNKSFCCESPPDVLEHLWRSYGYVDQGVEPPRHGALAHALSFKAHETDFKLISIILQHNGDLSCFHLKEAFATESSEIVRKLLFSRIEKKWQTWMEEGVLHEAVYFCPKDIVLDLIVQLCASGMLLDRKYIHLSHGTPFGCESCAWETGLYPSHMVDIAAQRGDLETVELLLSCGAYLTEDSIPAAIRGGDMDLVRFIIGRGASLGCFSSHYKSTPFADALRLRDENLRRLIESTGFSIQDCAEYSLCAILAAAAEIGDCHLVKRLLPFIPSEKDLGWALCKATVADKTDVATLLLNSGATVDPKQCSSVFGCKGAGNRRVKDVRQRVTFALHNALRNRNHVLVQALLDHDALPFGDEYGYTPMEMAVRSNAPEMIEMLISAGATVKCRGKKLVADAGPVISTAVRKGYTDCVRFLVQLGADINAAGPKCGPPLAEAVRIEDTEMMQWLLANGADPMHDKVLCAAICSPLHVRPVLFETLSKIQPGNGSSIQSSTLTKIIEAGEVETLRCLLRIRPRVRVCAWPNTFTPLAAAIRLRTKEGQEMTQMLLDSGIDVDDVVSWDDPFRNPVSTTLKESALLVAINTKEIPMVKFLLGRGANINGPARMGVKRTPLQKAAEVGSYAIVQLLLNQGAAVNAPPAVREGATALQLAAMQGFIGIVELLLEWHADPNAAGATVRGRTAIEGAAEHGRFDMVKYLHNRCFIESQQYTEASRLAKKNGHNALAEMILSLGADLQTQSTPPPLGLLDDPGLADERFEDERFEDDHRRKCGFCNALMSNTSALRRHERSKHGIQSHLQCPECPQRFRRRDILLRHQNTHRQPHQRLGYVVCPSCSKSCRKDYLLRHQRTCRSLS